MQRTGKQIRHRNGNRVIVHCPVCRVQISAPEDGLPPYRDVNDVLDLLPQLKERFERAHRYTTYHQKLVMQKQLAVQQTEIADGNSNSKDTAAQIEAYNMHVEDSDSELKLPSSCRNCYKAFQNFITKVWDNTGGSILKGMDRCDCKAIKHSFYW